MCDLMSLKLRTRNPPRMFQWDAVDISPDVECPQDLRNGYLTQ